MRALDVRLSATQESFAARLRAAREHARLTPEQLAIATKVTTKRIHELEAGGSAPPSPDFIIAAAGVLKVQQLWLMSGSLAGDKFMPAWFAGQGGAA